MRSARKAASFPSIRLIEEGGSLGFSFAGGKPTRPVSKPLSDLPARLKWMDEQKIERQVVGGWLDMFGYEVPAEEGAAWSRLINTHLAQTAKREPRFVPLATVPLQDGARAAEVLREAHASRLQGRDDRHAAQGQGRRARRSLAQAVLGSGQRTRFGGLHPSGVRERRRPRARLRHGQCGRAHHRHADRDVAADLCRPCHPLCQREDRRRASAARRCLT